MVLCDVGDTTEATSSLGKGKHVKAGTQKNHIGWENGKLNVTSQICHRASKDELAFEIVLVYP